MPFGPENVYTGNVARQRGIMADGAARSSARIGHRRQASSGARPLVEKPATAQTGAKCPMTGAKCPTVGAATRLAEGEHNHPRPQVARRPCIYPVG